MVFKSNVAMVAMSESSRLKSKMFKFSAMCAFWRERGMATIPLWKCHLRHTCAIVLLCFLAMVASVALVKSP